MMSVWMHDGGVDACWRCGCMMEVWMHDGGVDA